METLSNTTNKGLILSATSIIGTPVRNDKDESIGKIEDLMINTQTGEMLYTVLSVDTGFLDMGSKYFAVPLQRYRFDTIREMMILDVPKEKLESAPGFDKDNWPTAEDEDFLKTIFTHYNVERYHHSF
ncbi:PRC-barrel domain containing protein [Cryomorpha ignava]|uniref:PRC-barrel domain containing protein n=1 Tax=Cryomorpha ignava TaxID=101383 RepID=A0A7K3WN73_9FLAO|nr:PRC-barrel domain-containing protein [Cryomorpha ignava]NEN23100.1 PRC-barrel domain containing protein [Cryomorpha ignava]